MKIKNDFQSLPRQSRSTVSSACNKSSPPTPEDVEEADHVDDTNDLDDDIEKKEGLKVTWRSLADTDRRRAAFCGGGGDSFERLEESESAGNHTISVSEAVGFRPASDSAKM